MYIHKERETNESYYSDVKRNTVHTKLNTKIKPCRCAYGEKELKEGYTYPSIFIRKQQ